MTVAQIACINVTIVLPVIDETASLRKTVEILLKENRREIVEILLIACEKTSQAALATCDDLVCQHPGLIQVRLQERPYLGGAMRDAFDWASGTHILMMASDLETDPTTAKDLIAVASRGYDVVTATRWSGKGAFQGYNPVKYAFNLLFQKFFRILYSTSLSDLHFRLPNLQIGPGEED